MTLLLLEPLLLLELLLLLLLLLPVPSRQSSRSSRPGQLSSLSLSSLSLSSLPGSGCLGVVGSGCLGVVGSGCLGVVGSGCLGVGSGVVVPGSGAGIGNLEMELSRFASSSPPVTSIPEPGPFGLLGSEGAEGVDLCGSASLSSPKTGEAMAGALRPDTSTITAAPVRTILFIDFLIFVSFFKGVASSCMAHPFFLTSG